MLSVKTMVEMGCLTQVPPKFVFPRDPCGFVITEGENIPIIDYSRLTSGTPNQRSKAIQDLGNACREWGFFMVINHGVPRNLMEDVLNASRGFFELPEEEKKEYAPKNLFDPVKYGTSFNALIDKTLLWRDNLKLIVHPHFNAPKKPVGFGEILEEYCKRAREIGGELIKGICVSLGLEERYIHKELDLEVGSQLLLANLYPPCPQPELAIGMPPHSDHGLLTLLFHNELDGLQVQHNKKWVPIRPLPNSLLVNTGDHMEIVTNGRYKSVIHRALVSKKGTRMSVATAIGAPLDKVVRPAPALVDASTNPAAYRAIKYRDYIALQQSNQLNAKSCLDLIRL